MNYLENKDLRRLTGADGPTESHGVFLEVANRFRVLPPAPFGHCMPWHARGHEHMDDPSGGVLTLKVVGGRCCHCSREIAVPKEHADKHMACIYCGFERGEIPEQEIEP